MSKTGKSTLVGRELIVAACVTGAVIFLMLWLVGDRSFLGSLIVGAVLGFVVHYVGSHLKGDSYTPPAPAAPPIPSQPAKDADAVKSEAATPAASAPSEAPVAVAAPETVGDTQSSSVAGVSPTFLTTPGDSGADDLKKIRGVGPKLEQTLNGMGVFHFAQVAAWTEAEVAWVDDNLEGFKGRVTRDDWVAQAKALASDGGS